MATNRPRYTVSVDDDMFQKIEDFRFEKQAFIKNIKPLIFQ